MAKGYGTERIREKLIDILGQSKTGLSGVEIAEKLKINRATISNYLKIFAAEGLIKQKNIGSTNLWFIGAGVEQLNFPADFFQVKNRYMEYVLAFSNHEANNLIRTSIHCGANPSKLINEVIIPTIIAIGNSYENGKMGRSERNFLDGLISNSLTLIGMSEEEVNPKKNIVILATDPSNMLLSKAASSAFQTEKWKTFLLGDMSPAIDVLFDIDLERFLNKIWGKRNGMMIVIIFSSKESEIKFFSQAVDSSKKKFGKNLRLAICTSIDKKIKVNADLISDNIETLMQWCQTTFENL